MPSTSTRAPTRRRRAESVPPETLGFYGYRVADVMTRPVVTVAPDATLTEAASRMSTRGISGLPVVGPGGRVLGVLSQQDILRRLTKSAGLRVPGGIFDLLLRDSRARRSDLAESCRKVLDSARVRDAMSRPAVVVEPTASLDDAVQRLVASKVNRLPVVRKGRLVGIVTRTDLLGGLQPPPD